jgi:hypothetical protein
MQSDDTAAQRAYIDQLAAKARADRRVLAAWLEGSFGRGNADRYSDVDLHLLLDEGEVASFRAGAEGWLAGIQTLVLYTLMFEGRMVNALTSEGLRLDVWLHAGDSVEVAQAKAQVLVDKGQRLALVGRSAAPQAAAGGAAAQILDPQIKEFWRCCSLIPAGTGRRELIVGFAGLNVQANNIVTICLAGLGTVRDRGVKNLNQFLPADVREELEGALALQGLSPESLLRAHLDLLRLGRRYGRQFAQRHGIPYPAELEAAVVAYLRRELEPLGYGRLVDDL